MTSGTAACLPGVFSGAGSFPFAIPIGASTDPTGNDRVTRERRGRCCIAQSRMTSELSRKSERRSTQARPFEFNQSYDMIRVHGSHSTFNQTKGVAGYRDVIALWDADTGPGKAEFVGIGEPNV